MISGDAVAQVVGLASSTTCAAICALAARSKLKQMMAVISDGKGSS